MKTIDSFDFSGKKALIRVDFNVPLNKETFAVTDDTRIRATLPTIKKVLSDGGSCVLMSHLGRPKEGPEDKYSLRHLVGRLAELCSAPVHFAEDCAGKDALSKAADLKPGEILLLENLRFYKEEEKGDVAFAEKLSEYGDIYVNDAFGTAHRAHASTAVIARFFAGRKCFGYVMAREVANAEMVLKKAERPFTAIVGGAKVSDKLLILENLLDIADNILIGGGMAYTFLKGMGAEVGNSLLEEDRVELTRQLIKKAEEKKVRLLIPADSIVADAFSNDAQTREADNRSIEKGWMGLDIGAKACEEYKNVVLSSKTILWNGPMGVFEMPKFEKGTRTIADAVVEATKQGAFSLIGGGDSAAAIAKFGYSDDVSYVSTGGGALLEYFEGKVLPGVAAILEEESTAKG
jgi:phosphoglycerate kinase